MSLFRRRQRVYVPQGSGDLEELKLDILSRSIPEPDFKVPRNRHGVIPVKSTTVVERLTHVCDYLVGNQWDPNVLAAHFKTPLETEDFERVGYSYSQKRKLDTPTSLTLKNLYMQVDVQTTGRFSDVATMCLGLMREPKDPKTGRLRVYCNHSDPPQLKAPNQDIVDFSDDISAWMKLSINFNKRNEPVLNIGVIQMASIDPQDVGVVKKELQDMMGDADEKRTRELNWKINSLEDDEQFQKNPFSHKDRGYALALIALQAAELLGIKNIGLRSGDLNPPAETLHDYAMNEDNPKTFMPTLDRRYLELVYFLKKGNHGFNIQDRQPG